jgi:hypothetical protein
MSDLQYRLLAFLGMMLLLGVINVLVFLVNKNNGLKHPMLWQFVVCAAVLFLILVNVIGFPPGIFLLLALLTIFTLIMNLRFIHFCNACGKTVIHNSLFTQTPQCPKCGAKEMRS